MKNLKNLASAVLVALMALATGVACSEPKSEPAPKSEEPAAEVVKQPEAIEVAEPEGTTVAEPVEKSLEEYRREAEEEITPDNARDKLRSLAEEIEADTP